jgi:hypothetical protein
MFRFFITGPPTRKVPVDERFDVIAQALERAHQGLRIGSGYTGHWRPAVKRVGDLIQIPTDRTDLGDAALECRKLRSWQRRERPQVRAEQEPHVRAHRHLTRLGTLAQQQQVIRSQPRLTLGAGGLATEWRREAGHVSAFD